MIVSPDVTLRMVQEELVAARAYAAAIGLTVDDSNLTEENLRFLVIFENCGGEKFYVEFDCCEYPLHPPTVEFLSRDGSERGIRRLYPKGFHNTPCVCSRYNRKAYKEVGGPHSDWRLVDWRLPTGNGVAIDSLAMILSDLDSKIRQSSGRMA